MKNKKIFYGWLLCGASLLMLMGGTGIVINSASQFLKPVTEALGVTRGQFSLYITFVSVSSMALSPFVGKIYTKFSPRIVTLGGAVFMALGWICLSWAKSITLFYILGLGIGIGSTLSGMIAVSVIMNNWFHMSKGTAIGIASTGSGVGSMLFNPIASKLIVALGYQAAYRWLGIFSILCLLPMIFLYRYKPEDVGMRPLGSELATEEGEETGYAEPAGIMRSQALKTPALWGVCFVAFALSASCQGVFSQAQAYFTDIGYSPGKAAVFVSLISLSMALCKVLFGFLNDRLGTRKNYVIMVIVSIIGILLMELAKNETMVYLSVIVFGCTLAATFVLCPMITIFAFGPKDYASIYGLVTFFIFLGPAVAPPLSGLIYDINGSYTLAFIIYALLLAVALAVGFVILKKKRY